MKERRGLALGVRQMRGAGFLTRRKKQRVTQLLLPLPVQVRRALGMQVGLCRAAAMTVMHMTALRARACMAAASPTRRAARGRATR